MGHHPMLLMYAVVFMIASLHLLSGVEGHGYIRIPMGRPLLANSLGQEYCQQCLSAGGPFTVKSYTPGGSFPANETTTTAVRSNLCGEAVTNTDPKYNPYTVPSSYSLPVYKAGDVLYTESVITAPHGGHFEIHLCNAAELSDPKKVTWQCLSKHVLQRVYAGEPDPVDPAYPTRYYFEPACWPNYTGVIKASFRLPAGLTCERCILQWWWVTGNSCNPPGYRTRTNWPAATASGCKFWSSQLPDCKGDAYPEEFWNCGDIKIISGTTTTPPPPARPSPLPPAPAVPITPPSPPPAAPTTPSNASTGLCQPLNAKCQGYGFTGKTCCRTGSKCYKYNDWFYQCLTACPTGWDCNTQCASLGARCYGPANYTGPRCCRNGRCFVKTLNNYGQCASSCPEGWYCQTNPPPLPDCMSLGQACGGKTYTGPTCCKSGQCFKKNVNYSQCRPSCPLGWACNPETPNGTTAPNPPLSGGGL